MLTLVLLASLTQVYQDDFYFMAAQENWVIDNLPKPVGYMDHIPPELAEQVALWREDCWRCRKGANERVLAMGPSVVRWLFWPLRAKDLRVSMHAESMINALIRCRFCEDGTCGGFTQPDPDKYTCEVCGSYWFRHAFVANNCIHCGGAGVFSIQLEDQPR